MQVVIISRKQQVGVDGSTSILGDVLSGVPQGSIAIDNICEVELSSSTLK